MDESGNTTREAKASREADAAVRGSALREMVDSARALTGAAHSVMTTVDEAREPRDFVASGLTPEQRRAMEEWPDGLRPFAHLRIAAVALRLPDLDARVRALGCSPLPFPSGVFQATPMRH